MEAEPSLVTALAWPRHKAIEGCLGISIDTLLIGCVDGSVAMIQAIDSTTFHQSALTHCCRANGMPAILCMSFLFRFF